MALTYNPYDFANPVEDAALFIGRKDELADLEYYIEQAKNAPHAIHLALLGPRASGKTSLLNMARLIAERKGFCGIGIDLTSDDVNNQLLLFHKVFNALLMKAFELRSFGGVYGPTYYAYLQLVNTYELPPEGLDVTQFPFQFPVTYALAMRKGNANAPLNEPAFASDLHRLRSALDRPILLTFDEAALLSKSEIQLQRLRNVFLKAHGYMIILTGTPELLSAIDKVFSPINRQFKKVAIGPFNSTEETELLIRRPLEKIELTPDELFNWEAMPHQIREIHDLTGGRPYEIQLLCHVLFRRIQQQRTNQMELDLSALEEVRSELDRLDEFSPRPLLSHMRSLSKVQLEAFSVLAMCCGNATPKQTWAIDYMLRGAWHWEDLLQEVEQLLAKSILEEHHDTLHFRGDDFDRIYIKYLAREQDVRCEIRELTPIRYLTVALRRELGRFNGIRLITPPPTDDFAHQANALIEDLDDPEKADEIYSKREALAEIVYHMSAEYGDTPSAPVIQLRIDLKFTCLDAVLYFRSSSAAKQLPQVLELLQSYTERASVSGGEFEFKAREVRIAPIGLAVRTLKRSGNEELKRKLGTYHAQRAGDAYLADNQDRAVHHAGLAVEFSELIEAGYLTNLGYLFLITGDLNKAEELLQRALSTGESAMDEGRHILPALPLYDLSIVRAKQGHYKEALDLVEQCIAALGDRVGRVPCQSLLSPVVSGEVLKYIEIRDAANLVLIAKDALETLYLFSERLGIKKQRTADSEAC